jgi:hypothetical protein
MGIHSAVIDSATDEGSVYQLSVCCSGFDIRLRAPFERHEEVGDGDFSFMAAAYCGFAGLFKLIN